MIREVLILGAGPAGMAAALELCRSGKALTVIEKNDTVGGLARTFQYGEFRTDTGPHRFFSKNQYLYDLIEDLLAEHWIKVNRLTRFYINGKFFLYPVDLKNAFINLGPFKAVRMICDYLYEKTKKTLNDKVPANFEEKAISDFGRSLAGLNMLNYTEKIWGLLCNELSPDWAEQRIRGLSPIAVIKNAIFGSKGAPKTLVDQFYYPDLGTGLIYEKMKERVLSGSDCEIKLNSYPVKIRHKDNKTTEMVVNSEGKQISFQPAFIISSIPITIFIQLLDPPAPEEVFKAIKSLRFRSHVSLFITLDRPTVFPDQWIYFPDKQIPFGRIMEPKNFSRKMAPWDKTSLLIEFFCWEGDKFWSASKEELFELSIPWLEKLSFIERKEVLNYYIHKEKFAYPVYDLHYKENLEIIKNYVARFNGLQLIGRQGSFRYNNQDHAIEMGILAARSIIEGKQYNIDEVGAEQEYFEKGYVR